MGAGHQQGSLLPKLVPSNRAPRWHLGARMGEPLMCAHTGGCTCRCSHVCVHVGQRPMCTHMGVPTCADTWVHTHERVDYSAVLCTRGKLRCFDVDVVRS